MSVSRGHNVFFKLSLAETKEMILTTSADIKVKNVTCSHVAKHTFGNNVSLTLFDPKNIV